MHSATRLFGVEHIVSCKKKCLWDHVNEEVSQYDWFRDFVIFIVLQIPQKPFDVTSCHAKQCHVKNVRNRVVGGGLSTSRQRQLPWRAQPDCFKLCDAKNFMLGYALSHSLTKKANNLTSKKTKPDFAVIEEEAYLPPAEAMSNVTKTNEGVSNNPPLPPSAGMTKENQGTWDRYLKGLLLKPFEPLLMVYFFSRNIEHNCYFVW